MYKEAGMIISKKIIMCMYNVKKTITINDSTYINIVYAAMKRKSKKLCFHHCISCIFNWDHLIYINLFFHLAVQIYEIHIVIHYFIIISIEKSLGTLTLKTIIAVELPIILLVHLSLSEVQLYYYTYMYVKKSNT